MDNGLSLRCTEYHTKIDGLVPKDPRECQSGYARDDGSTGYLCTSVKYVAYGPYVNSMTNRVTYRGLDNQDTRQCGTSSTIGFDNDKSCIYMISDNLLYPDESIVDTSSFNSPFLDPDWMYIGKTDRSNCFCNSGTTSYCLPVAN